MKFAWIFVAAAFIAGCSSGDDTANAPTAPPPATNPAAPGTQTPKAGGGAKAAIVAPHAKGAGAMEKLAAHDKAMAEAKMNATGFAGAEAVFMQSCTRCHSGPTPKDELSLTSYAKVMKGCDDGPVIVAGNPDASLLVKALHGKGAKQMPPTGPLSEADIKKIVDWIKSGATNSSS